MTRHAIPLAPLILVCCLGLFIPVAITLAAQTYYVDGANPKAADANPGTEAAPWKTLARAGKATELKRGDTVFIESGVYREHMDITVSGEPGNPISFAAAPGARVVIKGSEIVKGPWTRLADPADANASIADKRTWKVKLGEEFFTDPRFTGSYADKSKRWVSQVFWQDQHPLRMIGPDGIYKNDTAYNIEQIGSTRADMIPQSFFFDPSDQTLYVNISGEPSWYVIEVGVRGFALTASTVHDVAIRGLEMRHNRQPGGQWPLCSLGECERVMVEDCRVAWADFAGFSLYKCRNCTLRRCEFSHSGAIGLAGSLNEDCVVEDCKLMFNNYRHIGADWGVAAGAKMIPGNKRVTFRGCEAAYNDMAEGIWFDTDNEDIRILDNVCHHNGDCGIFFEINKDGGVIAGNLVYANGGRGIYVSGSQKTYVVHNTVVGNDQGIVAMTRAKDEPPKDDHILNNLLINNYVSGDTITRGADLILESPAGETGRAAFGSTSDYNVYANNSWTPFMRHNWNDNNDLTQWQHRYQHDLHSRAMPIEWLQPGTGFRLLTSERLDMAAPLPPEVRRVWSSADPKRVGSPVTEWLAR
jgi:parallel beta-helix repeat protein